MKAAIYRIVTDEHRLRLTLVSPSTGEQTTLTIKGYTIKQRQIIDEVRRTIRAANNQEKEHD